MSSDRSSDSRTSLSPNACPIAVVGMSCLFPKAGDLKTYWENILTKVDAISNVPADRWDADLYFDKDKKGRDKIYSKWGGFIDPVVFDPLKYGLPPNALKSIDPQQLLSLEATARALDDAGANRRPFDREYTACFFGIAGGMGDLGMQYGVRASLPLYLRDIPDELLRQMPEWTEDSFPGILPNVVSGRIANVFDLGGSNFTVDAACASGLTAVYLGVRELLMGTANVAIVGAADVMQTPFGFLCFAKTQALTPSGKPKPFDAAADGIVISEGIGVAVLKRLADAEREGDRIYAVIRGVGSSSDGRGKSLTAPQAKGQLRALDAAYRMAGPEIGPLELVEAHGTGTVLGDGTEAETVSTAMLKRNAAPRSCAVGSVKSQIGHTKGCAGMAGLIKTALALHYKVLPPTINVSRPSAQVFIDPKSPAYVNTEARPWIRSAQPRRAGVNSFGFGGTNFHALMEEYAGAAKETSRFPLETWPVELFMWTGDSHAALDAQLAKTASALADKAPRLRDLAHAINAKRGNGTMRLAVTAESVADLLEKIGAARKHLAGKPESVRDPRGIFFSAAPVRREGKIAFLFPGQGSQRPDMLRDLTVLFPELRERFECADRVLKDQLDRPLSRYVFPPPRFTPDEEQQALKEITVTNIAQPALGACEMGMFHLLDRIGIRPDMTAGHSSGEYAALCAAGVFSEETLYEVLEDRGASILETATGDLGTMMAVKGELDKLRTVIRDVPGVYVANFNSPEQTILSGRKADLDTAAAKLEAAGLRCKFFPISCAFHSPIIEPARRRLASKLETISYRAPGIPVYSNVSAAPYSGDANETLALLSEHLIASVRFVEEIEAMYRDGARVFIEVGPGQVLTNLVSQILKGRRFAAVATDAKSAKHDLVTLLGALAQLFAEGVEVDLSYFDSGRELEALDPDTFLPKTPPKKPSAAAWVVAPDRAWPISQSRPPRTRISMAPPPAAAPAPAAKPAPAPTSATPLSLDTPKLALPPPAPGAPSAAAAEVVLKYQRMMAAFLDQQKEIMMAYLGGAPAPATPTAPPASTSTPVAPVKEPSPIAAREPIREEKREAPAPQNERAVAPAVSFKDRLLAIVAERTGYPAEMLDPNLDVESDLGIDSIKRLEILIAFAKEIPGAPDDLPERLSSARTLAAVLNGIAPYAGQAKPQPDSKPVAATKPHAEAAVKPAPVASASFKDRLVALVAERTGYPAEMLDLNLDVESDLGIDSIKRLEILIAFAKEIPGAPDDLPEKLSTARTLAAVLDGIAPYAGQARPQPESKPVAATKPQVEAAAKPAPVATASFKDRLVALVAERTGYPPEMLDLNLDVESDLGIDSIKRLEILIAFAKEIPGAPDDLPEKLSSARTLAAVLDGIAPYTGQAKITPEPKPHVESKPAPAAHAESVVAPPPPSPAVESTPISPAHRILIGLEAAPLPHAEVLLPPTGVIVITNDGQRVAEALAHQLDLRGAKTVLVSPDQFDTPSRAEELIGALRAEHGPIGGLIHLLPLRATPDLSHFSRDRWKQSVREEVKGLYHLLRAAARDLKATDGAWMLACASLGRRANNGCLPPPSYPWRGGLMGLVKSVADEWPKAHCKIIDTDNTAPDFIVPRLLDELAAPNTGCEIYYRAKSRWRPRTYEQPVDRAKARIDLGPDDVVMIIGGARGITAEVAREIARAHRPTLLLVGRSPWPDAEPAATASLTDPADLKKALFEERRARGESPKPIEIESACRRILNNREMLETRAALERAGSKVFYYQADVQDASSIEALFQQVYATHGRLDGVINGAGIIEDKLIEDKTPDSFDRVFDNKVDAVFHLSRLLDHDSLKFVVLFSSIAGWRGNRGQADYAAANEVLNRMAMYLVEHWQRRVVAIDWGPWGAVGMASEGVQRQFKERGVGVISPEAGRRFLLDEITYGEPGTAIVVAEGPLDG